MNEDVAVGLLPLWELLGGLAAAVLLALATFAINWVRVRIGLEKMKEDDIVRGYLEKAIRSALAYGISKLPHTYTADDKTAVLGVAAQYLIASVPDAMKRFGLTEQSVLRMLESRLATLEASNGTATGNTAGAG